MNNELMTIDNKVTLLDMRMDSKRFPRLESYPREVAVAEMAKIVTQAFLYRGQSADPTNIQFISANLVDELQANLDKLGTNQITFAEISRIVKRAVLQEEMYGISVASLYKVIIEYIKGEGHRLHKQAVEIKRQEEEKQLKDSIIAPMLQAYSGALVKHSKL